LPGEEIEELRVVVGFADEKKNIGKVVEASLRSEEDYVAGLSGAETLTAKVGVVCSSNSGNTAPADETIVLKAYTHISGSTADIARPV
jgi:hypothetical protein